MEVAILLFDRFTALDAVGPYQVLASVPGVTVAFVATTPGLVQADRAPFALSANRALAELTDPDIVLVPGGPGQVALMTDEIVLSWLRDAHAGSTWTTSVCTGSLVLGAAGVLKDKRATTHWLAMDQLAGLGALPVAERVVFDGKVVTAAGVSAGIDMALALTVELAGPDVAQTIQLGIEYDPAPPFDSGSPAKAPPHIVEYLRSRSRFVLEGDRTRPSS
jgi:putative intracellular protease/amidase